MQMTAVSGGTGT